MFQTSVLIEWVRLDKRVYVERSRGIGNSSYLRLLLLSP